VVLKTAQASSATYHSGHLKKDADVENACMESDQDKRIFFDQMTALKKAFRIGIACCPCA